jgi:hypothetical protein
VLHAAHRHDASLTRVGGHSRTLAQARGCSPEC